VKRYRRAIHVLLGADLLQKITYRRAPHLLMKPLELLGETSAAA
jgi:hypothetical protein